MARSPQGNRQEAKIPGITEAPRDVPEEFRSSSSAIRLAVKLSQDTLRQDYDTQATVDDLVRAALPENTRVRDTQPLVPPANQEKIAELVRRATTLDPTYQPADFGAWYLVEVEPEEEDASAFRSAASEEASDPNGRAGPLVSTLNDKPQVERVHPLRLAPPPAVINPTDDPRISFQGYLNAAPDGIDARYAWTVPNGDGTGIGFVDLEQGWNFEHEDLVAAQVTLISGSNAAYFDHGTSVLGEVLMTDNTVGGVGIAPGAIGRAVSQWQPNGYNTAGAIIDAILTMQFGDILLLEAQTWDPTGSTRSFLPIEVEDASFDAIRLATALGITVVEAGANGGYDLDTYVSGTGARIFNRNDPGFRDSGAILVGAASSWVPHERLWFSNYGSRVDLYGWGENVDTATTDFSGTDDTLYTSWFSGTSSASPIVSGAGLIVQSLMSTHRGRRLSPLELRQLLTQGGTPSAQPDFDRIGVLPNLKAIIETSITNGTNSNLTCDVRGKPHGALLSPKVRIQSGTTNSTQECKKRCVDVQPFYISHSSTLSTCKSFSIDVNDKGKKGSICTLYAVSAAGNVKTEGKAKETFYDVECQV